MKPEDFLNKPVMVNESLADEAAMAERDHEVQTVRAALYYAAKRAVELHAQLASMDMVDASLAQNILAATQYLESASQMASAMAQPEPAMGMDPSMAMGAEPEIDVVSEPEMPVDDMGMDPLAENWATKAMAGKSPLKKKYKAPSKDDSYEKRLKKKQYGSAMGGLKDGDLDEGYKVLPSIDRERYQARQGLEGPFRAANGKVYYYDAKEGKPYDPETDMYIDYDDFEQMDKDRDFNESDNRTSDEKLRNRDKIKAKLKKDIADKKAKKATESTTAGAIATSMPGGNGFTNGGPGTLKRFKKKTNEATSQGTVGTTGTSGSAGAADDKEAVIKNLRKAGNNQVANKLKSGANLNKDEVNAALAAKGTV